MATGPRDKKDRKAPNTKAAAEVYAAWQQSLISGYEELAKKLVVHKSEKGRVVEGALKGALRSVLPSRFGIGTGFAITASGSVSPQLDLVIYDGIYNSPIVLEGGVGLFPIESIYGFVEVKSSLGMADLSQAMKAIGAVRSLSTESRYVAYQAVDHGDGPIVGKTEMSSGNAPRSFLFAVRSRIGKASRIMECLSVDAEKSGAHVHGFAILDKDYFLSQEAYKKPSKFICREGKAFARFCACIVDAVQSLPMAPASMTRYLGLK